MVDQEPKLNGSIRQFVVKCHRCGKDNVVECAYMPWKPFPHEDGIEALKKVQESYSGSIILRDLNYIWTRDNTVRLSCKHCGVLI